MDLQNKNQEISQKYSYQNLQKNKKEMLKILKESPVCGVYYGQTEKDWQSFFDFYMNFLKSQVGPRGQCSKAVRSELSKKPQFYDQILSLLNLNHKTHIKDIYVKYKLYSPCNQYDQYVKTNQCLQKNEQGYKNILNENSIMYKKIKQGMIIKRGEDYDYKSQIEVIRQKYQEKIKSLKERIQQLKQILLKTDNYVRYIKLKQQMKPYFQMWKQADRKIGYESIQKGDVFQKIVKSYIIPIILQRSKIDTNSKYSIETNCRWFPKALGEIDIAILLFDQKQNRWKVVVLIECKSRLYDIREAFKQVNNLKQKGKQQLWTTKGILQIVEKPEYFIVTTLPQNPFLLPIQSQLKQRLQKGAKNLPINQIKSQELYPKVRQALKNQLSPLQWFLKNDSDRIIVLNY